MILKILIELFVPTFLGQATGQMAARSIKWLHSAILYFPQHINRTV